MRHRKIRPHMNLSLHSRWKLHPIPMSHHPAHRIQPVRRPQFSQRIIQQLPNLPATRRPARLRHDNLPGRSLCLSGARYRLCGTTACPAPSIGPSGRSGRVVNGMAANSFLPMQTRWGRLDVRLSLVDIYCIVTVQDANPMSQLNIHMTPAFVRTLKRLMRTRGIKTKSEAIRMAVQEALQRPAEHPPVDWTELIGIANKFPDAPRDQWLSEDELWESTGR